MTCLPAEKGKAVLHSGEPMHQQASALSLLIHACTALYAQRTASAAVPACMAILVSDGLRCSPSGRRKWHSSNSGVQDAAITAGCTVGTGVPRQLEHVPGLPCS